MVTSTTADRIEISPNCSLSIRGAWLFFASLAVTSFSMAGLVALLAASVARLYLSSAPAALHVTSVSGAALAAGSLVAYLVSRAGARHAVERARLAAT